VSCAVRHMTVARKIGKYEVIRKLGAGATSTVYLARDPFAEREVAVKLVAHQALDDPAGGAVLQRLFLTEAALAGKLSHPHIVEIFDAVADEDAAYIVMEHVSGGTLRQYARSDCLMQLSDVVEIMYKCTRALDFALRLGVIHRDIKPDNILVHSGTDIKISDFGSAAMLNTTRTVMDNIGTPAYMSPEQHLNESLSCQTDIYALGVVMFQLLTGRLPFHATNIAALAHQILHDTPPPPSRLHRGIPEAIDRVVLRALERHCADRYQSWQQFSDDLASVAASGVPLPSERVLETEKFDALRGLAFFGSFGDVDLWEVLRFSAWQTAKAGETIVREAAPGDACYVLVSGSANVMRNGRMLSSLAAGECFGEMAYLGAQRIRHADVVAASDVRLLCIPVASLASASELCRLRFDRAFLDLLVERLDRANVRLAGA
jgi:eukaryotic-like serine/threonine-protein kinase